MFSVQIHKNNICMRTNSFSKVKNGIFFYLILFFFNSANCSRIDDDSNNQNETDILGFELLNDLKGHWIGSNETAFGTFDWFAFDFRPISPSHLHSIYEGASLQNIITSIFVADFEGEQRIMARNGGWLGPQYRATYFVLDRAERNEGANFYRLVDAVGGEDRAFIEFRFEGDTLFFDAYKDNSGSLDKPIHHMGFRGINANPDFANAATTLFNFPQKVSEVNFENAFNNLVDSDSALFLEESADPFPKSQHGHVSDLKINIARDKSIQDESLLLYISAAPIVDNNGQVLFDNLDTKVIRTISVNSQEEFYLTTYLHPGNYFITAFSDRDGNFFPSPGDVTNVSKAIQVTPEGLLEMDIEVALDL